MAANNIPYPDAVRDNQWTCDAFKVLVTNAYLDLSGSGGPTSTTNTAMFAPPRTLST